jgi:hypothetical protein
MKNMEIIIKICFNWFNFKKYKYSYRYNKIIYFKNNSINKKNLRKNFFFYLIKNI